MPAVFASCSRPAGNHSLRQRISPKNHKDTRIHHFEFRSCKLGKNSSSKRTVRFTESVLMTNHRPRETRETASPNASANAGFNSAASSETPPGIGSQHVLWSFVLH